MQLSAAYTMLRGALTSAATRVAGGAAVAAAAVPEVSHARAVQPRSVFPPRSKVLATERLQVAESAFGLC